MQRLSRATALRIAASISLFLGIFAFIDLLPDLAGGADAYDAGFSFSFFILVFIFAILRIVGSFGAWRRQRWGIILTLIANLLDTLYALPGLLFAPDFGWWLAALTGVVGGTTVIILCLWREPKIKAV